MRTDLRLRLLGAAGAMLAAAGPALAHVAVDPKAATAGAYQVLRFGVGHGCDGQATTALRIELPPGVAGAHPQPKPGWTLAVERGPDGDARAVVWRGRLEADQYDEFLIHARLPATPGPLALPAVQTCGAVEARWTDIPAPGGPRPARPAPLVTLTPSDADPAPAHHH